MEALLPLSLCVLRKVVVLLRVASLGRQEHASPHGEVDGGNPKDRDAAGYCAHPFEAIVRLDVCTYHTKLIRYCRGPAATDSQGMTAPALPCGAHTLPQKAG